MVSPQNDNDFDAEAPENKGSEGADFASKKIEKTDIEETPTKRKSLSASASAAELTVGELSEMIAGTVANLMKPAMNEVRAELGQLRRGSAFQAGGLAGVHANSGPSGHTNVPGHANFTDARFGGVLQQPGGIVGVHANSGPSGHTNVPGHANLTDAHLKNTDLRNANLCCINLNHTRLMKANLSRTNLRKAKLISTIFKEANLWKSNLSHASLQKADFTLANLSLANLEGADFKHANLNNADLSHANLRNAINLTVEQVKAANNWDKAYYNPEFKRELGLDS